MTLVLDIPGPDGAGPRVLAQLLSAALFEGIVVSEDRAPVAGERTPWKQARIGRRSIEFQVVEGAFGRHRVLPRSVRIDGAEPDGENLLAVLDGLSPDPARRDDLFREFSNTVSGLSAATGRAPQNRRALSCDRLDAAIYEGHPYHPAFRGRLGFTAEDDLSFGPETGAEFRLRWCLVRKDRLSEAGMVADGPREWGTLAGPQVAAAAEALAGRKTEDWRLLPVHPWQWRHRARDLLAPAVAVGDLHDLGEIGERYAASQSLRTLFDVERPDAPHLKLPLDVVNTSVPRTLEPHWILAAPALSDWFEQLVRDDPWLSENRRLVVLRETSASVFDRHLESAEQVGLIWRENPAKALDPGESAVPLNALTTIERDCDPFVQPWIERYGARAYADRLIEVVVQPFVHLLVAHGVAAEAHAQNVVLVHRDGWPVRIAVRDFSDNLEWVPDFLRNVPPLPRFEEIDATFADPGPNRFYWMETVEDLRWLFMDAALIFSMSEISFLLERRYGLSEFQFFDRMALAIRAHVHAFDLDDRLQRLGFDAEEIVTDTLLSSKLGRTPTPPLCVPNPLSRVLSSAYVEGAAA